MDTIGQRIRIARNEARLTQAELAEKIDVVPQQVSKYERELDVPTLKRLELISEVTKRPVFWFFLGPTGIKMDYPPEGIEWFLEFARGLDRQVWQSYQDESLTTSLVPEGLARLEAGYVEHLASQPEISPEEQERLTEEGFKQWEAARAHEEEQTRKRDAEWERKKLEDTVEQLLSRVSELEKTLKGADDAVQDGPPRPRPRADRNTAAKLIGSRRPKQATAPTQEPESAVDVNPELFDRERKKKQRKSV